MNAESQPGPEVSIRPRTGGGSATRVRLGKKVGRRKSRLVREEKTRKGDGDDSR